MAKWMLQYRDERKKGDENDRTAWFRGKHELVTVVLEEDIGKWILSSWDESRRNYIDWKSYDTRTEAEEKAKVLMKWLDEHPQRRGLIPW